MWTSGGGLYEHICTRRHGERGADIFSAPPREIFRKIGGTRAPGTQYLFLQDIGVVVTQTHKLTGKIADDLRPDAWERFEKAVDAAVKHGPAH